MYVNVTCLSYYEMPDILTYMLLLKIDKFSGMFQMGTGVVS